MTPVPTNSSVISQPIAPSSSSSSLLHQQSEPSQSEKIFPLTQQQVNKFRNICAGVFRNEMSIKEAAYFSGLDEELVKCWIGSLEDIAQESVEKSRKYEDLKKHCEVMEDKMKQLRQLYLTSTFDSK